MDDSCCLKPKKKKRKRKRKRPHLLRSQLEEMKLSGGASMFALATVVLVAAVCVAPRAAVSNGKYNWAEPIRTPALGWLLVKKISIHKPSSA